MLRAFSRVLRQQSALDYGVHGEHCSDGIRCLVQSSKERLERHAAVLPLFSREHGAQARVRLNLGTVLVLRRLREAYVLSPKGKVLACMRHCFPGLRPFGPSLLGLGTASGEPFDAELAM